MQHFFTKIVTQQLNTCSHHTQAEKVEDDIIEIATVLREKANEMVDKTGSLNFGIIQPMIDEIQVLKAKYK